VDAQSRAYRHLSHEPSVAFVAGRQHGLITAAQLADLGFDKHAVKRRVLAGRLHRVHRGVYAVGHPAISDFGRYLAAVLACGPGAALSHRAAAHLHGMRRYGGLPEVTVPRTGAPRRAGMHVHTSTTLTPDTVTRRHGIPVTTPERTLVDLADVVRPDDLARTVSAAERAGLADRTTLWVPPGRRNPVRAPHVWTRSHFERRFVDAVGAWGLPVPLTNQEVVEGWEVDCWWAAERLAVELDHPHTHLNPERFELDRLKDQVLAEHGITVRRVTERRFAEHPLDVRAMLARALGGENGRSRG
jgi:very-short-patch-repair endonuclease